MLELTFGEQVKIILSRKGMTIKELAEKIEKQTGKKMVILCRHYPMDSLSSNS